MAGCSSSSLLEKSHLVITPDKRNVIATFTLNVIILHNWQEEHCSEPQVWLHHWPIIVVPLLAQEWPFNAQRQVIFLTVSKRLITSVQSTLTRGRIAVFSPLVAANASVRRVGRAGTFAMRRYVTMGRHISPLKSDPSFRRSGSPSNIWFLGLARVGSQTAYQILNNFRQFCTAQPCGQHTDTQTELTQTTLRVISVAIGRIYVLHEGNVA